ncbi:YolD-like family protein [Paenibacillus sp. sgz500958]|uniref:YolD-like family protein n=1 Tax=Paenibacillus sp. sgz500958 TaxID=3242475 RepID=UPI0036D3BB26
MGKKLEGNGLWESCRMMLPEHKNRIIFEERETLRREKPVLDEQEREEMERTLVLSLRNHVRVSVVLFDPFEDVVLSGFITSIHAHSREIKLQWAEEWKWINLDSISRVYTC